MPPRAPSPASLSPGRPGFPGSRETSIASLRRARPERELVADPGVLDRFGRQHVGADRVNELRRCPRAGSRPGSPGPGSRGWTVTCWAKPWMVVIVAASNSLRARSRRCRRGPRSVAASSASSSSDGSPAALRAATASASRERTRSRSSAAAARVKVTMRSLSIDRSASAT